MPYEGPAQGSAHGAGNTLGLVRLAGLVNRSIGAVQSTPSHPTLSSHLEQTLI
jgi:hypothetical protein